MKNYQWLLLLLLLFVCNRAVDAHAQVTLQQYLDRIEHTHPFFEQQNLQVNIEEQSRDRAIGNKDWLATATPGAFYRQIIENSTFAPNEIVGLDLIGQLEREYWGNGSRLAFGYDGRYTEQDFPQIPLPVGGGVADIPAGSDRFYQNRLYARYSYPLMQNYGGELDRLEYELGDYGVRIAEVTSVENEENFLLDMGVRFIDWVLIEEQVRISEDRLDFATEQLGRTRRKRDANLVDEVDYLNALDLVQRSRENHFFNQSRFLAKRAELEVLAQVPPDSVPWDPDMDLYELQNVPDVDEATRLLSEQRVIRALREQVRGLTRENEALDDITRPQLWLVGQGALQQGDPGFWDAWKLTEPDVFLGLEYRHPLGAHTAKADVARNTYQVHQIEKQIHSVHLDLEAEIRRIWISLDKLIEVLELNRQQIATARDRTAAEQERYNQGRGQLNFVIQARDNEAFQELSYAVNAAAYQSLVLQYRATIDLLYPSHGG